MKIKSILSVFATLAAAMTASAVTIQFNQGGVAPDQDGTFDWNTPSRWFVSSAVADRLPTKEDDTWVHVASLRGKEVYIRSGTNAECKQLNLANTAWNVNPVHLIIDGGSLTTYGQANLGNKSCGNLTIQNGGTLTAKNYLYFGRDNDEISSGTVYVTNRVLIADTSSSLTTGTSSAYMGHQRKGLSLLENHGTISFGGQFNIGYCNVSGYALGDSVSIITNSGTINAAGAFRVGFRTNSIARVENTGNITLSGEFTLGHNLNAQGYLRHSGGTLAASGSTYVGLSGNGYLELAGGTESVFTGARMRIASNNDNESGTICSSGELVITNSASLSRDGKAVWAGAHKYSTARIALYDDAKLSDISNLRFGNVKTDNSFEVYDNAVVSNVDLLVLNVGDTSTGAGITRMRLSGNAKVCDITNMYVGSNSFNHAELEIADNASLWLRDDAWTNNFINVARDSYKSGDATIRMRGGMIALGIRGALVLGNPTDNSNAGCTSRVIGYGCITNQGDSAKTLWSRLDLCRGSVTADGEGAERDLDFGTFARLGGSIGDGRNNLNKSGTNGWYAINKGRLIYPNRDAELVRFVGDYARLNYDEAPKFVNSMRILLKDNNDAEITTHRKFTVELYAPDRTDIPAGLVEDDDKNRRLGVWSGNCGGKTSSFAKAETTIRYDQWRLAELKSAHGNSPLNLAVCLYQYDGTKWKKITSYPAEEAAAKNYRISGTLAKTSVVSHNLGWFAVVAREVTGTVIVVR